MTPEQLAEIRARCEAATPGPWLSIHVEAKPEDGALLASKHTRPWKIKHAKEDRMVECVGGWDCLMHVVERTLPLKDGGASIRQEANFKRREDATFAATARADIPALLAEVGRLQAVIAQHDLCHDLHGKVDARAFADGCAAEQRKLYGCAPDADEVERLRAALAALAVVHAQRLSEALSQSATHVQAKVAEEREACARMAGEWTPDPDYGSRIDPVDLCADIAAAIRARKDA